MLAGSWLDNHYPARIQPGLVLTIIQPGPSQHSQAHPATAGGVGYKSPATMSDNINYGIIRNRHHTSTVALGVTLYPGWILAG